MAVVKQATTYDGSVLQGMFTAATLWLEKCCRQIDALNVFPVPDGDTGTNMLLTMRSTVEEAQQVADSSAEAVAGAIAKGALMGARGNSGVILCQFLRGLARGLEGRERFTAADLAAAMEPATELAYRGLSRPVEGTILTVIRDTADAARQEADAAPDLASLLEVMASAASRSVARTPTLLPVLRQAGVVDAGGQGLAVILEGALRFLRGEGMEGEPELVAPSLSPVLTSDEVEVEEEAYGYCTEFLLQGERLDADLLRRKLEKKGVSVIVAGDHEAVKVHLHTFDPGGVLRYTVKLGTLHDIHIQNMDDQHREYQEMRRAAAPPLPIATVAVTWGEGMAQVFHGLGVSGIVPGGSTMNPSTRELLRAVEAVPSEQVILLPNNGNVVPAAQQVASLTAKQVVVVPTHTQPQGVAALLAINPESPLEENAAAMETAAQGVATLELTRAVRPTRLEALRVRKGQAIAILDGELVAAGATFAQVVSGLRPRLGLEKREVVTVYTGSAADPAETEAIAGLLRSCCPGQVEVVAGGQPHYNYIVSLE
ncbi:MAG: DAK2 domain-containing protein [Dehalococcoidia bacterium]